MARRIAWVTSAAARGTDPDEPLALAALRRRGVHVNVVDWHDPAVRWGDFDRAVLRSPWDYQQRTPEFLEWLDRAASLVDLRNPPAAVRWSLDKHYLLELAGAGVPVVETQFVEPGSAVVVGEATSRGNAWIVKPSIGAGSSDVAVFCSGQEEASRTHVAGLHGRGLTALVQPLLPSVGRDGEWPMVFFAGRFSHSANKFVRLPGASDTDRLFAAEDNRPHLADDEQLRVASQALDVVQEHFGVLTYARIDLVRADDGSYLVLEVEVFEPSLFLPEGGHDAVERCADALVA